MKLKHTLSMVLLSLCALLGFPRRREEIYNEASTAATHANGIIPLVAEVAVTSRYLLVAKGSAANGIILAQAGTRPLGVCLDEPSLASKAAVAVLGCTPGTLKVRCSAAINLGDMIYTAANGRVTNVYATTAFLLGRAVSAAAGTAGDDTVEIAHCFPLINAAATL